ncbi:hypothetical protein [Xylella fastidiosa]|uniref:hypothetical protein n=1 Tax=Xylella fastidiosa TaxID=2371 RepID=UPI0035D4D02D
MPACLRACVPACLRACVPACLRACVPACLRACVPACLRACVPAYRGDAIATAHDLEGDKKRDYYSGSLCRNACK